MRQDRHPVSLFRAEGGKGRRVSSDLLQEVRIGDVVPSRGKGRPAGMDPRVVRQVVAKEQGVSPVPPLFFASEYCV